MFVEEGGLPFHIDSYRSVDLIGIVVGVLLSWLVLKFGAKTTLKELAQGSGGYNLRLFSAGLLFAGLVCVVQMLWQAFVFGKTLELNPELSTSLITGGVWWTTKSVIFEELLFRGALLVVAVRLLGNRRAILLSASCFGVFHWFTIGGLGNPVLMVFIFLLTGLAGLVWAHAFVVSRSLLLPIGLHLGWNLVTIVVFSNGPIGSQLLLAQEGIQPTGWLNWVDLALKLSLMPGLTWFFLRMAEKRGWFEDF